MNSNRLGLLGLVCIVVALAALAGPWWSLLAAGVLLVGLAYVAHRWEQSSIRSVAIGDGLEVSFDASTSDEQIALWTARFGAARTSA